MTINILVQIFVIFICAKIAGELFERMRQPPVIGELLVGIIIANTSMYSVLGLFENIEIFNVLAELGVIFLLFSVGLETRMRDLVSVGRVATTVAFLGVLVPFGLGFTIILILRGSSTEALFIGAAMVATSVGITARVLADLKVTSSVESRIILGAAVIDDVIGMIVLTIVSGITGVKDSLLDIGIVIVLAIIFVILAMFFGTMIVGRISGNHKNDRENSRTQDNIKDRLSALRQKNGPFVISLIFMFRAFGRGGLPRPRCNHWCVPCRNGVCGS